MLLGLLSDSHGRAAVTANAVTLLLEHGAELLLHLGDIGTDEVIDELARADARIVFGNCDWNAVSLAMHAEQVGVPVDHPMGLLKIDGRRVAYTHGHLEPLMRQALGDGVEYLLHGHTHEPRDERVGATRIINPGALHRAARYTCALLDTSRDAVSWLQVTGNGTPGGRHP